MNKEMSLYLDLIRFVSAFLVFVYHSFGNGITGGFLWQIGGYGHTAVMVFFVLSGYVIAYVSSIKEKTLQDYVYARVARLYSVIVPALIVTLICNEIGRIYIVDNYVGPWNENEPLGYLKYIITLLMFQDVWSLGLSPENNGPFWSITFEAAYYIIFAVFIYTVNKPKKVLMLLAVVLVVGPTIMFLFPVWLLGVWLYKLHSTEARLANPAISIAMFVAGLALLALSPTYRAYFDGQIFGVDRESPVGDYLDALAITLNLLAAPVVARIIGPALLYFSTPIRFLASLTFSFYLFHQPLVRLLAGVSPFIDSPSSFMNRLFVLGGTFLIVVLVGLPCEKYKAKVQCYLRKLGSKNELSIR